MEAKDEADHLVTIPKISQARVYISRDFCILASLKLALSRKKKPTRNHLEL